VSGGRTWGRETAGPDVAARPPRPGSAEPAGRAGPSGLAGLGGAGGRDVADKGCWPDPPGAGQGASGTCWPGPPMRALRRCWLGTLPLG
jgi:hypothetical protein